MSKRAKFWLRVLAVCAGLFAILLLIYCYLAFAPSGYKRFEREHAGSIERAQIILTRASAPQVESEQHSSAAPAQKGDSIPSENSQPDFVDQLDELGDAYLDNGGYALFHGRLFPPTGRVSLYVDEFGLNAQGEFSEWPRDLAKAAREKILWRVRERLIFDADWEAAGLAAYRNTPGATDPNENPFVDGLPGFLDDVEDFLLKNEWRIPDYYMSKEELWGWPLYSINSGYLPLAVFHAAVRNDPETAAWLLKRSFDAFHYCPGD